MRNNKTCKACGEKFHYCDACGIDEARLLGFCSDKCMEEEHKEFLATSRKIDPENIGLEIDSLMFTEKGLYVEWSSDIGFGQWWLGEESSGNLIIDSEHMDKFEDRAFSRAILHRILDRVTNVL